MPTCNSTSGTASGWRHAGEGACPGQASPQSDDDRSAGRCGRALDPPRHQAGVSGAAAGDVVLRAGRQVPEDGAAAGAVAGELRAGRDVVQPFRGRAAAVRRHGGPELLLARAGGQRQSALHPRSERSGGRQRRPRPDPARRAAGARLRFPDPVQRRDRGPLLRHEQHPDRRGPRVSLAARGRDARLRRHGLSLQARSGRHRAAHRHRIRRRLDISWSKVPRWGM